MGVARYDLQQLIETHVQNKQKRDICQPPTYKSYYIYIML